MTIDAEQRRGTAASGAKVTHSAAPREVQDRRAFFILAAPAIGFLLLITVFPLLYSLQKALS
jgi:hypothetical protein